MTLSSTVTQRTDPLETPMDEQIFRRAPKGVVVSRTGFAYDGSRIRAATPDATQQYVFDDKPLPSLSEAHEGDIEQNRDYFSIPPAQQTSPSPLSRRGNTKELIGRWESMSSNSSESGATRHKRPTLSGCPSATTVNSLAKQSKWAPNTSHSDNYRADEKMGDKKKGKSPIRQSIRNFLSVFKKGRMSGSDKELREEAPEPPLEKFSLAVPVLRMDSLLVPRDRDEKELCTSPLGPIGGLSGALLYLSRTSTPDTHSVWMNCTAELHSTHVLVTWHTTSGNPSTTIVSFKHCTDVRSLTVSDLSPEEKALFPSGPSTGDPKIFELLFEGRPREKFATTSVGERASWVSAIWDAILQAQDERTEASSIRSRLLSAQPTGQPQEEVDIPRPPSLRIDTTVANGGIKMTINKNRELPALPPSIPKSTSPMETNTPTAEPIRYQLHDPPVTPTSAFSVRSHVSALPRPPTTPNSLAPPLTPSRSQSPSVQNLGQMSMVKQRLAQIENRDSGSPLRGSPSPAPRSTASSKLPRPPDVQRQESATSSTGANSLIDAYGSFSPISPSSQYSGRLTTIASTSMRRPLRVQTDLDSPSKARSSGAHTPTSSAVSPTSRYSAEGADSPTSGLLARLGRTTSLKSRDDRVVLAPVDLNDKGPTVAPPRPLPQPTRPPGPEAPELGGSMQVITQSLQWLQGQSTISGNNLWDVQQKVTAVLEELREHATTSHGHGVQPADADLSCVLQRLEEMRLDIKMASDMRAQELAEVKAGGEATTSGTPIDTSELHAKLDSLEALCRGLQSGGFISHDASGGPLIPNEKVEQLLELLRAAQPHWASGAEQQLDSIRYLHELNSWLEAFVNHGTAQMDGVSNGVQRLCYELGVIPEGEEGAAAEQPSGGILAEIRGLLTQMNEKETASTALHVAVNGLAAVVQEDVRVNTETRNALAADSIVGLITRQREDHERMLRTLGAELSNEIRGERLRFVEAMKEATQINVQTHVEEFKKELTREVMLMTQEVQRLQKERQDMEQQIADLFAFYSKQKQMAGAAAASSQRTPTRSRHAPPPLQGRQRSAPPSIYIPQRGDPPPLHPLQVQMPGSYLAPAGGRPLPSPMGRPTSRAGSAYN